MMGMYSQRALNRPQAPVRACRRSRRSGPDHRAPRSCSGSGSARVPDQRRPYRTVRCPKNAEAAQVPTLGKLRRVIGQRGQVFDQRPRHPPHPAPRAPAPATDRPRQTRIATRAPATADPDRYGLLGRRLRQLLQQLRFVPRIRLLAQTELVENMTMTAIAATVPLRLLIAMPITMFSVALRPGMSIHGALTK